MPENTRHLIRELAEAGKYCFVPSVCLVEATCLVEKGRLTESTFFLLREALSEDWNNLRVAPFDLDVARAMRSVSRADVSDLPDRVIALWVYPWLLGMGRSAALESRPSGKAAGW